MIFFHRSKQDKILSKSIKNIIGTRPGNIFLYKLAFRHRSVAKTMRNGTKISNERLEYLGDAILTAVVADFLFKKFPYKSEGFLTEMRSKLVSRETLNKLSKRIGIQELIDFDGSNSVNKSICGDTFEALIGAVYLDFGYKKTKNVILHHIYRHYVDVDEMEKQEYNFKSKLIEWGQKEKKVIQFKVCDSAYSNQKYFTIQVLVDDVVMGEACGVSKKKGEQLAAEKACAKIFK